MLLCYSCQDNIIAEAYHDDDYQAICQFCQPDWSNLQPLKLQTVDSASQEAAYTTAYQAFLDQVELMREFFTTTATMLWTLPIAQAVYYQAELKASQLVQDQFEQVKVFWAANRQVQDYPTYTFVPPGRIVKKYLPMGRLTSIVVSNDFWDRIMAHPLLKKLSWLDLSRNPNCDLSAYRRYPQLPWNVSGLSYNPNLSLEWLQAYPDLDWDWSEISYNSNVTATWLAAYPTKRWVPGYLLCNNNFDISWLSLIVLQSPLTWSWYDISQHRNFQWHWAELYPNQNWYWYQLSHKVPPEYLADHITESWQLSAIVKRPEFSLDFLVTVVARYRNNPQAMVVLCSLIERHPQLNLAWLLHFQDLDLHWADLSHHDNFTWAWCDALPNKLWDWSRVAEVIRLE